MSGFNATASKEKTATTNLAGGKAYKLDPEVQLVSMLLTSMVEDTAYEAKADRLARLKVIIASGDLEFAAKAAMYARHEFGMRSITHAMAAELAHSMEERRKSAFCRSGVPQNPEWLKHFFENIVRRPDDMGHIIAYFLEHYGRPGRDGKKHGLTNAMRKGFGARLSRMRDYALSKYKGGGKEWKMVDIVNMVHPKATEALTALMNGTLAPPQTWEVALSEAGQVAAVDGETKEEAVLDAKATAWYSLLKDRKIGYLALLRNLRNIIAHAPACIPLVCEQLVDPALLKHSMVFPFQFVVAIKELVGERNNREVLIALTRATNMAVSNIPVFPGRTLIALDCSGSMKTTVAAKASYSCMDIASLFAAALYKSQDAEMLLFGSTIGDYNPAASSDLTSISMDLARRDMGGTNMAQVFEVCTKQRRNYDRIFILSDGEAWQQEGATGRLLEPLAQAMGRRPAVYMWDFSGGGTSQFSKNQVTMLSGFSEKVFDLLKVVEQDKDALVNAIRDYAIMRPLVPAAPAPVVPPPAVPKKKRAPKAKKPKKAVKAKKSVKKKG